MVSGSIVNTATFLYETDILIDVPGVGLFKVDIAFGENFNVILNSMDLGIDVRPKNVSAFIKKAELIKRMINEKVSVVHPEKPFIKEVSHIQFYEPPLHPEASMKNIVVSPPEMVDRSPCGTRTCARIVYLYSKGGLHPLECYWSIIPR